MRSADLLAPALALLLVQTAWQTAWAAPTKRTGPWILTCDMPTKAAPAAQRVFRLGPKLFEERKADGRFGYNLCASFRCAVDHQRLEGVISSPSLILTVTYDPATSQAGWRTQGASGLSRSSGRCAVAPDAPAAH